MRIEWIEKKKINLLMNAVLILKVTKFFEGDRFERGRLKLLLFSCEDCEMLGKGSPY